MKVKHYIIMIAIILLALIIYASLSRAESKTYTLCMAECRTDVMSIHDCIEDERQYWDTHISDAKLKKGCQDLIRNERLNCEIDCFAEEVKAEGKWNRSVQFWEEHVKNFPETNQLNVR